MDEVIFNLFVYIGEAQYKCLVNTDTRERIMYDGFKIPEPVFNTVNGTIDNSSYLAGYNEAMNDLYRYLKKVIEIYDIVSDEKDIDKPK